jgi:hypothetical protein
MNPHDQVLTLRWCKVRKTVAGRSSCGSPHPLASSRGRKATDIHIPRSWWVYQVAGNIFIENGVLCDRRLKILGTDRGRYSRFPRPRRCHTGSVAFALGIYHVEPIHVERTAADNAMERVLDGWA